MTYTDEQITELNDEYDALIEGYKHLLVRIMMLTFSNKKAEEYAKHGFLRRIGYIKKCIDNIYEKLPPDVNIKPCEELLSDITINLQSFIFNCFGCLDNLAHIWVYENNANINERDIGFSEKYSKVRKLYQQSFRQYLDTEEHKNWYEHLQELRHALAHRIPPYVPPYTLSNDQAIYYNSLNERKRTAAITGAWDEFNKLSQEEDKLEAEFIFIPCMTHSFNEASPFVYFHAQIISDWHTIMEISKKFFDQFNNTPTTN